MAGVAASDEGEVVTGKRPKDSVEYNIAVMVVLALETVTPQGSVAVWRDGHITSRTGDAPVPHAARFPSAWIDTLATAGVALADVNMLAVVSGPGSFTGVRIGMASAQGLALTRGWQVTAIPTLDAIAECWRAAHLGARPRTVMACLDGLRSEVFVREFLFDGQVMHPLGAAAVVTPGDVRWTPHPGGVSLVGSGASRYASVWSGVSDDIGETAEPIAAGAARLAAGGAWPAAAPHALRPLYVRRPDVELARERGRPGVG
jgi:tRNA threonylcarbamoyladenosine biosynthesis protein TsaB